VLATGVLPSGHIDSIKGDPLGLTKSEGALYGLQTQANNNVVPTLAVEYFLKPNISFETICCVTGHHVSASANSGAVPGVNLVDHITILPATLTVKYHLVGMLPAGIKPYVGVGPAVFIMLSDRPSETVKSALGVTRTKLSSNVGAVVQAGVDVPVGHGYGISLDAKKYFVGTTAHFYAGSVDALDADVKLDPWVISAGVSYRF